MLFRSAQDIRHSVSWWGVSYIKVFTVALMGDIVWGNLSPEKRAKIERKMCRLARKISNINFVKPARTGAACKFKFMLCRLIVKSVYRKHQIVRTGGIGNATDGSVKADRGSDEYKE